MTIKPKSEFPNSSSEQNQSDLNKYLEERFTHLVAYVGRTEERKIYRVVCGLSPRKGGHYRSQTLERVTCPKCLEAYNKNPDMIRHHINMGRDQSMHAVPDADKLKYLPLIGLKPL